MNNVPTAVSRQERLIALDERLDDALKLQREQLEAFAHVVHRLGGERLKILGGAENDTVPIVDNFADAYEWKIRQVEQLHLDFSDILKASRSLI